MSRLFTLLFLFLIASATAQIKPGDPIDYSKLAFYPDRWVKQKHSLELIPWKGKRVVFLTMTEGRDPKVMGEFIGHLDAGWELYGDLTGQKPRPLRMIDGLPTIAAVPGSGLTCGYGCGYVGATGIEMTSFYSHHYSDLEKDPNRVPHAYFYEMGRNYFTFGGRHDCFTTGFAVFMRYVCTDTLKIADIDAGTRKVIDKAIDDYAKSDLSFLKTFTNAGGLTEKQNRLKASPTDQPVMYASAMLHLRKELGDEWVGRFFRQLVKCPEAKNITKEGARAQCLAWFVSASCAAKKDLSPIFVDQWRLEVTEKTRKVLKEVDWKSDDLDAGKLLKLIGG